MILELFLRFFDYFFGVFSVILRMFFCAKNTPFWAFTIYYICLAAEGDTADGRTEVPAEVVRGGDCVRSEAQVVGFVAIVANREPVVAGVTCEAQAVAWVDVATPDKHQRRLHNSIRIS